MDTKPERPASPDAVAAAWKILEHNRTFNTHFDFKFGPILVVASAAVALLGGVLKDYVELLKVPVFGAIIALLSLAAFVCLFMTFLHVLAAISPSLTMFDRSTVPGAGKKRDKRPDSLIFFDDICRRFASKGNFDPSAYHTALSLQIGDEEEMLRDIADQIVEVAAISSTKAERVRKSATWLFVGLLSGGAAFFAMLIAKAVTG